MKDAQRSLARVARATVLDAAGRAVLTMPGDREIAVLDLAAGTSLTDAWFTEASPLGIALRP